MFVAGAGFLLSGILYISESQSRMSLEPSISLDDFSVIFRTHLLLLHLTFKCDPSVWILKCDDQTFTASMNLRSPYLGDHAP